MLCSYSIHLAYLDTASILHITPACQDILKYIYLVPSAKQDTKCTNKELAEDLRPLFLLKDYNISLSQEITFIDAIRAYTFT